MSPSVAPINQATVTAVKENTQQQTVAAQPSLKGEAKKDEYVSDKKPKEHHWARNGFLLGFGSYAAYALYNVLSGKSQEALKKLGVDLPKKAIVASAIFGIAIFGSIVGGIGAGIGALAQSFTKD